MDRSPGLDEEERNGLEKIFTKSDVFSESITGFVLYDPESESILHNRDAERYFTPASNTKILTLYAALQALPDTLASLRYTVRNDTLYFRGTGDPSFLSPYFDYYKVYDFLKNREEVLVYDDSHFRDEHFGEGWPWDWYPQAYAPEKSPFPIYGNMMRLHAQQVALVMLNEEQSIEPAYFEKYIENMGWDGDQLELVKRDRNSNTIYYAPKSDTARQVRNIPFIYDRELIAGLLADTLGRDVLLADNIEAEYDSTLYTTPAKPLYERMMLMSDNLIAEQLMLMISDREFGTMNTSRAIQFSLNSFMNDLPQRPRWSDGSGLTRYNLITPYTTAILLENLYQMVGHDDALSYFPAGGVSGTLSGWYRAPEGRPPFVYAKTGTLRNSTSLSGYLFTDSGRRLIFSFHNNNYVVSNNVLRTEMNTVLQHIRENY